MKNFILIIFFLVMGIVLLNPPSFNWQAKEFHEPMSKDKVKGICWEARDSIVTTHIESMSPYHVNWISQTPFGWQQQHNSTEIAFHSDRGLWGERDIGLIHTANLARQKGIKTLLKPHIWLSQGKGKWRSDIEMESPEDWDAWFAQYERFILHHAKLAEAHQFEGLCIGTELYIAAIKHESKWRAIIKKIRVVYSGQLTYAANFYKEYEEIQFWDALDYIGIQAYFPLTDRDKPTVSTLKKGWLPHHKALKKLYQKWKKPIVFTEFGYRSSTDAAIRPWEWESRGEIQATMVSPQTQAHCYQAVFETFWKENWFGGVFLWKWSPENYGQDMANRPNWNSRSSISFSPKAEGLKVIEQWYKK